MCCGNRLRQFTDPDSQELVRLDEEMYDHIYTGRISLVTSRNRILDKVRLLYRELGLRGLLARLLRQTLSKISSTIYTKHTELLIVKSLDDGITSFRQDDLQILAIEKHHSRLIQQFNERHRAKDSVVASICYLMNDYKGFMAFFDNNLAGYWWWVSNETSPEITHPCVDRFELRLKDDEVFAFDYFIAPEFRDHGIGVTFLPLIYRELKKLGYRKAWGFVDADNVAARWVYRTLGNKVVRRIVSHEVCSLLLFQDRRVFIRNAKRNSRRSFDRRLLFSFKPRTAHAVGPHERTTFGSSR